MGVGLVRLLGVWDESFLVVVLRFRVFFGCFEGKVRGSLIWFDGMEIFLLGLVDDF